MEGAEDMGCGQKKWRLGAWGYKRCVAKKKWQLHPTYSCQSRCCHSQSAEYDVVSPENFPRNPGIRHGVRSGKIRWHFDIYEKVVSAVLQMNVVSDMLQGRRFRGLFRKFDDINMITTRLSDSVLVVQDTHKELRSKCSKCPEYPALSRDVIMLLSSHFRNNPRNDVQKRCSWWTWRQDRVLGTHLTKHTHNSNFLKYSILMIVRM